MVLNKLEKVFGVNIDEWNNKRFLFEFPDRYMAELIIQGQWRWKSSMFHLDWWSPTTRYTPSPVHETWIRVVGIPLHLWSRKVFQEIGDLCGDWIKTKEETELKNHLSGQGKDSGEKNNRRNLPGEVSVDFDGMAYFFTIWVGSKPKFGIRLESGGVVAGEDEVLCRRNRNIQRSDGVNIYNKVPKSHPSRDLH